MVMYTKEEGYALYFGDVSLPIGTEVVTVETTPGQTFYIRKTK